MTASSCRSGRPSSTATSRWGRTRSSPSASRSKPPNRSGVPVLPVLPFGMAPYFRAFPGSMTLRISTYVEVAARPAGHPRLPGFPPDRDRQRPWWQRPRPGPDPRMVERAARVARRKSSSPAGTPRRASPHWPRATKRTPRTVVGSRTSRGPGWTACSCRKPASRSWRASWSRRRAAADVRELTGDGSFGGSYALSDEVMDEIWQTGVTEVRELIESGWADFVMSGPLTGRTAIVTGTAHGIGAAIAAALAEDGAHVVGLDRIATDRRSTSPTPTRSRRWSPSWIRSTSSSTTPVGSSARPTSRSTR